MNRSLTLKLGTIALLILLLMIPLLLIDGLVGERQRQRDQVLQDIARSASYRQQLSGPILIVPYRKTVRQWKSVAGSSERYLEEGTERGRLYFLPDRFVLNGDVRTELRYRGIYQARLYHSENRISGQFNVPAQYGLGDDIEHYQFDQAFIAVGISDVRGIGNDLKLRLNDTLLNFQPGTGSDALGAGVHVPLPELDAGQEQALAFAFELNLQGTEQLSITPVGRDSQVELRSDWPHPSFIGDYLPTQREVSGQGFTARWQTSFFATDMEEALNACVNGSCGAFQSRVFGVSFIDPVDQYLKADRAIKYALLFITLTFAVFFLFEVLKRLAVHPVQYALVGLSLALFYLLLLSLSEHLGFALAYGLSALGCVALNGFYVSSVLRSWSRGMAFGALLATLYGLLYGLLGAEDYALLMGSLLVFAVLGCIMLLTRKLDWYGVGKSPASEPATHP
ncbi:cell envelope integrity protein CreD [Phytopseudomonas dryadis]|uniref:Cell envelope integrity protein CreD n=1 Tax=Phytopseudomonas dryadis TaxID=2487520 RepID=A0ABY1Z4Y3_9GAMM|nr:MULTISPECIES: cell envelope integrity protein CreD [Pseudomonas]TBV04627.1 cell envelope integrity protein CreD [Pseudomonas dryadis]TBV17285.1 cell envelope integrity protein CreD [Pseudomonas sp. FRB 230]